jgi:hypothetical protein
MQPNQSEDDRVLTELRKKNKPEDVSWLLDVVSSTNSAKVRNAAAIALADMKVTEAKQVLVRLLHLPGTGGHRGTLLYGLGQLGVNVPLAILVDMIAEGPYETRQEAVNLIATDRVDNKTDEEIGRAEPALRKLVDSEDEEVKEAARSALSYLTRAAV